MRGDDRRFDPFLRAAIPPLLFPDEWADDDTTESLRIVMLVVSSSESLLKYVLLVVSDTTDLGWCLERGGLRLVVDVRGEDDLRVVVVITGEVGTITSCC